MDGLELLAWPQIYTSEPDMMQLNEVLPRSSKGVVLIRVPAESVIHNVACAKSSWPAMKMVPCRAQHAAVSKARSFFVTAPSPKGEGF